MLVEVFTLYLVMVMITTLVMVTIHHINVEQLTQVYLVIMQTLYKYAIIY